MNIYFAPMEGVTDAIFRQVHRRHFDGVDKYFMPFISPTKSMTFTRREQFDMSPAQNAGMPAVPQILCNSAESFNALAILLRDMGYRELNLNLGCPSGTVTAKGKGSGLLRTPDRLRELLDGIYAHPVLPISIKTRIGYESTEEWPRLLEIYRQYPFSELIVHPRTRQEFYEGTPHREACGLLDFPYLYNGDLFSVQDFRKLTQKDPRVSGVMLGRGLVANPALGRMIRGGAGLTLEELRSFHDDLYTEYLRYWPESAVVGRMHLIIKYLCSCFEDTGSVRRSLRRARSVEEYNGAVYRLFHECPFKQGPVFNVDILLGRDQRM
ncbi:MAG: tRNA-dihydrouridine synthase family protein [Clostridia bacterium]|nr:tRNA-dihydrouridine synthase family protein [Clostridia bacterium]